MTGTIGPDVARAVVALHSSHPQSTALDILDVCLRQRTGRVSDFGPAVEPGEPFALFIADAFDKGMTRDEWQPQTSGRHVVPEGPAIANSGTSRQKACRKEFTSC